MSFLCWPLSEMTKLSFYHMTILDEPIWCNSPFTTLVSMFATAICNMVYFIDCHRQIAVSRKRFLLDTMPFMLGQLQTVHQLQTAKKDGSGLVR